ncbi:MAG TPA: MATE family efflux transporter, partial [Burkholderiaceae bacterium]|nr:MATE family efflux transporter [Burkholderiaceae bacterium]
AYMLPLALSSATSVLTAQAIGAGDWSRARRTAWFGFALAQSCALALAASLWLGREPLVLAYTNQPDVREVALSLIGLMAIFHVFDATQCAAAFALRAYRVAFVPMVIYAVALWGVGLGGGWWLAYSRELGVAGFWAAGAAGLLIASIALTALLAAVSRRR